MNIISDHDDADVVDNNELCRVSNAIVCSKCNSFLRQLNFVVKCVVLLLATARR